MSKFVSLLIVLVALFASATSFAFTPPPAPANGGYVVDLAGRMSAEQIQQLNQKIDRISKATKNEFGILLLQSMEGDNIEDVANATYKAWGVGKRGLDNGCLIVVAIKERKSRIETGKGVEGEVTDLQSSDILKKSLNPHLKQGDFFGGFNATLDSLSGLMETRINQKAEAKPVPVAAPPVVVMQDTPSTSSNAPVFGTFLVFGIVGIVLLFVFLAVRSHMREQERLAKLAREEARLARDQRNKEIQRRAKLAQDELNRMSKLHQEELNKKATDILGGMYTAHGEPHRTPSEPAREPKPVIHVPRQPLNKDHIKPEVAVAASAVAVAAEAERRRETARRQEEEDLREARRRERDREEENRRRREREEEEERSRRRREEESSSSSSSFDWGSSSSSDSGWGGGSDSGGGFGGGDSGGGGSSSDW